MDNQQTLQPGATLRQNTYRIEKVLGQGGFGITYLATDISLDRRVAIKEFFPKDYCDRTVTTSHVTLGTQSSQEFVIKLKTKFLKEARNIAKFDNPGIIKIHAAFEENNTAYYVMDYVEGMSISDIVKKNGPIDAETSIKIIHSVARALQFIHDKRMNHLDVKPANIMLRKYDNAAILIDFGLSKHYDSEGHQTSTTPMGMSHGFAPLEQYNAGGLHEFSPQTDVYSLAATLYYMISGIIPPQATKLIDEELTFPEIIPSRIVAPIYKAMSNARKDRYASVADFIADLDRAWGIEPEPVKMEEPVNISYETQIVPPAEIKPAGSSKWIYIAAAAVIAVAAAVFFILKPSDRKKTVADVEETEETLTEQIQEPKKASTPVIEKVDMNYKSHLGECHYVGTALNGVPQGSGVATWASGNALSYDGNWENGTMHGKGKYTFRNGDVFEGTFKNGYFDTGRFTQKSTGEYFDGTFKNGTPDKGHWYSKSGQLID